MFHSVGNFHSDWNENWLSMTKTHFEEFCKYLHAKKFKTKFLDHWYNEQNNFKKSSNTIYLTFDDGYLDNWLIAFPILKKYGLKATIFINPEFVDSSSNKIRSIQKDGKGSNSESLGFLNWEEIIEMQNSGLIDFQSHSLTHNYYFQSSNIIDIYENQKKYHWLEWLSKPNEKHLWLNKNQNKSIQKGYPIFEYGRSLGLRKYLPDNNFLEYALKIYNSSFNSDSFSKKEHINHLNKKILEYDGRMENDSELEKRYQKELALSKDIIEKKLNKKVEFLCWPGGGYNNISVEISKTLGYKASTLASKLRFNKIDNSGKYKRIKRLGLNSVDYFNGVRKEVKYNQWPIINFLAYRGNYFYIIYFVLRNLFKKIYYKIF